MKATFVRRAISLATAVPTSSEVERQSWVCRNLCEVGLLIYIIEEDIDPLDAVINQLRLDRAYEGFQRRLLGIRRLFGSIPPFYPNEADLAPYDGEPCFISGALQFAEFADLLEAESGDTTLAFAIRGEGERAYIEGAKSRPTSSDTIRTRFLYRPEFPHELRWRGWLMTPEGPTMVVTDERMPKTQLEVCYAVHNGTHLDHLNFFLRMSQAISSTAKDSWSPKLSQCQPKC